MMSARQPVCPYKKVTMLMRAALKRGKHSGQMPSEGSLATPSPLAKTAPSLQAFDYNGVPPPAGGPEPVQELPQQLTRGITY